MYIELDIAGGNSHVREAADLKNFSVQVSERADPTVLADTLAPLGQLEGGEHAWIDIEALRAATGRADDPEWSGGFDAMVAYAASKGWVNDAGTALRAHLEFPTAAG